MKYEFLETMSGHADISGERRAFRFRVRARCDGVLDEMLGRPLRLTGVVQLPGIAEEAECAGTLQIALPLGRRLTYALAFTGDNGKCYRFHGRKEVRYLHLLRTMTTLSGELFEDGVKIGEARLHFALRSLPSFLLSFRPWHTERPLGAIGTPLPTDGSGEAGVSAATR